ncbi:BRO-N domain-containing protein [Streptomyces pactum]|uniref:BRO-N domain-containing protein n=1 Tax=Streptomyces pactum TaxID=68249 RepID=UPI0036F888BB
MSAYGLPRPPAARRDALDVSDFVYAATGARVRRLTLPDGEHWFPAADVCRQLGYTTTRKALLDHVPEAHREILETVTGRHSLGVPAGRQWRRDLQMIDLQGLVLLVNGCTKPSCRPFKEWVSEVISTLQQTGSYALEPPEPPDPVPRRRSRSVPAPADEADDIAAALARMEARDARFRAEVREALRRVEQACTAMARSMPGTGCRPDSGGGDDRPDPRALRLRTEDLFAQWKARLRITEDVWAVAVTLLPALAETGRVSPAPEDLAARTGLTVQRVHACLRFLQKHRCIRQSGLTPEGVPVYVAELPPRR